MIVKPFNPNIVQKPHPTIGAVSAADRLKQQKCHFGVMPGYKNIQ